jgi:hypothetical protein
MQPYQQCVIDEKEALDEKRFDLEKFIEHNPQFLLLSQEEQRRLKRQANVMLDYSTILSYRIRTFQL